MNRLDTMSKANFFFSLTDLSAITAFDRMTLINGNVNRLNALDLISFAGPVRQS